MSIKAGASLRITVTLKLGDEERLIEGNVAVSTKLLDYAVEPSALVMQALNSMFPDLHAETLKIVQDFYAPNTSRRREERAILPASGGALGTESRGEPDAVPAQPKGGAEV